MIDKFEYKRELYKQTSHSYTMLNFLSDQGEKGWQVVSIVYHNSNPNATYVEFILMRKK